MTAPERLRVLVLAPACDGTDVGEAWCAHHWVAALAECCAVTLLTLRRPGRTCPSHQLPGVEVVAWNDLPGTQHYERFNAMLKPGYPAWYARARRWIRRAIAQGRRFDVIHQLTPIALRYPSPGAGFDIPLVLGPLAGSLETPAAFRPECLRAPWYTRLRALDHIRLRYDPWLRRSFADAAAVIGVAPYVREILGPVPLRRFELMSELGIEDLPETRRRSPRPGQLHLVHVGRAIRTKGLRDAVRAVARLPHLPGVTLESAGDGEDLSECRREAQRLGVGHRIRFHGRIPRAQVEALYHRADAFVFPSFREPSGGVVFESLRHGLPVITTEHGGPGFVVDDSCGVRVAARSPTELADDLATAIEKLAKHPHRMIALARGARQRMQRIGLWPNKVDWLCHLYHDVLQHPANARG